MNNSPSARNPVMTDNEDVRASKMIGTPVYNDQSQQIGTIDDILLGKDQKASQAVLSVGSFLGVGSRLVRVPYSQLQFGNVQASNGHRVVLPHATKDGIANMPAYHYSNG